MIIHLCVIFELAKSLTYFVIWYIICKKVTFVCILIIGEKNKKLSFFPQISVRGRVSIQRF